MAKSSRSKDSKPNNVIHDIANIAYDMEMHISGAIAIARTAGERQIDDEESNGGDALGPLHYRLEQIKEGHAQIAALAPYPKNSMKTEGRRP